MTTKTSHIITDSLERALGDIVCTHVQSGCWRIIATLSADRYPEALADMQIASLDDYILILARLDPTHAEADDTATS